MQDNADFYIDQTSGDVFFLNNEDGLSIPPRCTDSNCEVKVHAELRSLIGPTETLTLFVCSHLTEIHFRIIEGFHFFLDQGCPRKKHNNSGH